LIVLGAGLLLCPPLAAVGVAFVVTDARAAWASAGPTAPEVRVAMPAAPEKMTPPAEFAVLPVPSATAVTSAGRSEVSVCAEHMVLVEGEFCPEVKQRCLRREDPEDCVLRGLRCFEYENPSTCLSGSKKSMRYCIDREEYRARGALLAENFQSVEDAERECGAQGKRLCEEDEWVFACEGEEMRPYPYGFERSETSCNTDRTGLVTSSGELKDLRVTKEEVPGCLSPFGVHGMSGNVEEFVVRPGSDRAFRKGAYWQPGANHCRARPSQGRRDYQGMETGFRCCKDVPSEK
jgi:hypothetical protein